MDPRITFKRCVANCKSPNCIAKCINKTLNIPKRYKVLVVKKR